MSWTDLAYMGLTVRPFAGTTPPRGYRRSQFSAPFRTTLRTLARELEYLDAKRIIVELDVADRHIRLDGYPRADARIGNPCVAISFESKHGPLRYATGEFDDWQDNLRAIALSMEALRAVDRYGVSKRGEQYRGWRALPATADAADSIATREQAEAFLGQWLIPDEDDLASAARKALFATHPDRGGDPDEFRKVVRARELIGAGS